MTWSPSGSARVNRKGAHRWSAGHPWIYRSDIVELPDAGPGIVNVFSEQNRLLGAALWSPRSQIALRMLTRDDRPIDEAFWGERIAAAANYRQQLRIDASAYRLVHAEADALPSLIVDRYGTTTLVVQILSAGLESCRADVLAALLDVLQPAGILARNDVSVRRLEGLSENVELLHGTVPEELEIEENGVRYMAAPWHGQKTGAFLDQRENRARAAAFARGRALDCFAYHGSFALHLARAAREVVAVDSSAPALERARHNAQLNELHNITMTEANVFDFLRAEESAGARYDVVVVDPPAFAKRRDSLPKALAAYKEVNLRALKLLNPGGHLATFSCSHHVNAALFREMLEAAAIDARRPVRWIETRGQAADHPEIIQIPESSYLKGAILQVV
jgi:23S rRNA (cytosine1962-C5)-methyltransferase